MAGFILVEDRVLDSAAASITFNTGLTNYTKFRLTLYVIKGGAGVVQGRLNGDSGSNYVRQRLNANGSTASTVRATSNSMFTNRSQVTINANLLQTIEISKPLATTPARYTTSIAYISSDGIEYESQAGEWSNTADLISSITLFASVGNFSAGTRIVLEGAPGTAPVTDSAARLVVDGSVAVTDYSSETPWAEDYATVSLGPVDISALTPAQLNAADFGAALSADVPDGNEADVDALPIQLTYDIAVDVTITDPTSTLDSPNATLEWTAEVGGSPVTQASYRVTGRVQPSNALVYDSGTIASASQEHQIGSGTPVVPWASPQNGQIVRWTVTVVEDGTADPDGVGPAIEGSASVDLVTDWTPLPAITGLTATAVTEEA